MKSTILFFSIFFWSVFTFAQFVQQPIRGPISINAPGVLDGVYIAENIPTKKVIPYNHIREADVMWSKRVWTVIDLRQKFNLPLYYPMDDIQMNVWNRNASVWSLWTIIRQHVLMGDLTLYSPYNPNWEQWTDGDMFKYPLAPHIVGGNYGNDSLFREDVFSYLGTAYEDPFAEPFKSFLYPADDSVVFNKKTKQWDVVYPAPDTSWFLSKDIIQYKLKEDWFFDKERSVVEKRIIGIAPVVYEKDIDGNITGTRELFWLYFPECRYVFQNYYLKNRQNDAQLMSVDDLFWKRMFQSYIVKESNVYDRDIQTYKSGVDALLESEEIKAKMDNFENDLWDF